MIREKAVRNESLDRSNARDLEQVVRLLREVDVVSAFSNSNTEDVRQKSQPLRRTLRPAHTQILHSAKDLSVGITICIKV